MKYSGLTACGLAGGVGVSVGYFVPGTVAAGFGLGGLALGLGAADFMIKDSLKLLDERIAQELTEPRTALRRVLSLDCTRRALLRLNLVAMLCKGLAVAVAGLATQNKASPLTMAVGCGALVFGALLTGVIFVSHERLVTKSNEDAVDRAEIKAAKESIARLGDFQASPEAPERPVIEINSKSGGRRIKPTNPPDQ